MPDWEWLSKEAFGYSRQLGRRFHMWPRDPSLYQDVAQTALIRIWRQYWRGATPIDESHLLAYAKRVVYTVWMDYFRSEYAKKRVSECLEVWQLLACTHTRSTEDVVCGRETAEAAERMLDSIQGVAGQVLRMRYEEMRYEEIASALEIPMGTVKSRLNYARGVAKKRLAAIN